MGSSHAERLRAGWVSAGVSIVVFGGKVAAYVATGSAAIFSDAMESVVNVAAAALLVWSLRVAARPADRDHPYGHGKVEFFTAGLEGALILAAAAMVAIQALRQLVSGEAPQELALGIGLLTGAVVMNSVLGFYLLGVGRRTGSLALQADARHVLADVWTSVGVIGGLFAVRATGLAILDPLIALAVALWIVHQGTALVREAVRGLMDEADEALLDELVESLESGRHDEWIDLHGMRAWRSGVELHADFHLIVPRYFDALRLHAVHEEVELHVLGPRALPGDVVVHFDPCGEAHCAGCVMSDCSVRSAPLERRPPITRGSATRSDPEVGHAEGTGHYRAE